MRVSSGVVCLALVGAGWLGCSASDGARDGDGGSGAASSGGAAATSGSGGAGLVPVGGTAGAGATGGSAGAGGSGGGAPDASAGSGGIASGGSGSEDAGGPDVVFQYDAKEPTEDACAATTVKAEPIPLAVYIMLDKSGSMQDEPSFCFPGFPCIGGSTKWSDAKKGISDFVTASSAAGIKVALQYFPLSTGQCDGTVYDTPAVPMGILPGNATNITSSLTAAKADGPDTPTEGALNGLAKFTASYATANPTEKVIALLVTDGEPTGTCDTTPSTLRGIAAASFGGTPSVPVYVMGMDGADFALLNNLAADGGTTQAYDVSGSGSTGFLNALQQIRGQALGCEYLMPTPQQGIVDPAQVKVIYTGGGTQQTIPHITDQAACGPSGGGWYYDDNQNPSKILLCDSTCSAVQSSATVRVDIELGCLGS